MTDKNAKANTNTTNLGIKSLTSSVTVIIAKNAVIAIRARVKRSSRFEDLDNCSVDVESLSINFSSLLDESLNSRIAALSGLAGVDFNILSY